MPQVQITPENPAPQQIRIQYVDRAEVAETYADSVQELAFDGHSFRLVLGVTRVDERSAEGAVSGKRYTACRLVLPAGAAIDLSRRLGRVLAAMLKQGMAEKAREPAKPAEAEAA